MSKTTTSLYYIICSEAVNIGYDEFISDNRNQLTFFDNNRRIMSQLCHYENESIIKACQNTIFYGLDVLSDNRKRFEKEFINHFLQRNIKYQTFENSRNLLVSYCVRNLEMLNSIYNAESFILGKTITGNTSTSTNENESRNNNLFSDLPQNNTNINLNVEGMDYATNTTISKGKSTGTGNTTSQSTSSIYNIDTLEKVYTFKQRMFNELDVLLFSQIF